MSKMYVIHNNKRKNDIKYECMNEDEEPKANLRLLIDKIENEECEENYYPIDSKIENYNDSSCLMEEEERYITEEENIQHSNDKIMRSILKHKAQVAVCLNKWLNIEDEYKIQEDDLEEVTESYITTTWDDRITDIVYKDKNYDGVFYLIEHQTEINYRMAQRIAEYKNEIRRNYQKNKKFKSEKDYRVAKVIAIVLYTGDKKWDAPRTIKELEVYYPRLQDTESNDYKLIISKEFTIKELEEETKNSEEDILARIFLLDKIGKIKNTKEIEKDIEKLKLTKTHMRYIEAYINNIIGKKYSEEIAKLMKRLIQEKINSEEKDDANMLMEAFVDKFFQEGEKQGEKRGKKLGVAQGISQVAINMLKQKYKKEEIKKCTGLSDAKIKELEKSLQSA